MLISSPPKGSPQLVILIWAKKNGTLAMTPIVSHSRWTNRSCTKLNPTISHDDAPSAGGGHDDIHSGHVSRLMSDDIVETGTVGIEGVCDGIGSDKCRRTEPGFQRRSDHF